MKLFAVMSKLFPPLSSIENLKPARPALVPVAYGYKQVDNRTYVITPRPPRYQSLSRHGSVIQVDALKDGVLLVVESYDALLDIIAVLDSTLP